MKTQDEVAKSAEMCVISAILIDEKALENVIQTLKPEHFYFDELKAAYQALLELSSEGCVAAQAKSREGLYKIYSCSVAQCENRVKIAFCLLVTRSAKSFLLRAFLFGAEPAQAMSR